MSERLLHSEDKRFPPKVIFILVTTALLLVMGGVYAGYYFFADKSGISDSSAEDYMLESKAPIYFNMSEPMIINFPKGLNISFVQLSVSFLAANESTVEILKKHEPMLRNNLMMRINAQDPEQLKSKAGKEALQKLMQEDVNQVLSKMSPGKHIREVFFTAFVMQ